VSKTSLVTTLRSSLGTTHQKQSAHMFYGELSFIIVRQLQGKVFGPSDSQLSTINLTSQDETQIDLS